MVEITIRKATGTDAPALSALALRSKAHWGYSAELLSLWSGEFEISPDFIQQNPVFVAEISGRVLGWTAMAVHGEIAELEHMWIEPDQMRKGIGSALFAHVRQKAKSRGVKRMIATHPGEVASIEEQREMISLGAYTEYTFLSCMPARMAMTPAELVERLRILGVDNCIVTTDFGQWMNPPPAEGMRMAIATLLDAGMEAAEVEKLVKTTPAAILVG